MKEQTQTIQTNTSLQTFSVLQTFLLYFPMIKTSEIRYAALSKLNVIMSPARHENHSSNSSYKQVLG